MLICGYSGQSIAEWLLKCLIWFPGQLVARVLLGGCYDVFNGCHVVARWFIVCLGRLLW